MRYYSHYAKNESHLYPSRSVTPDPERSADGTATGVAHGPAYCGYIPDPDDYMDYEVFGREGLSIGLMRKQCSQCTRIEKEKLYTDPDWQRVFRSQHPEVFG